MDKKSPIFKVWNYPRDNKTLLQALSSDGACFLCTRAAFCHPRAVAP